MEKIKKVFFAKDIDELNKPDTKWRKVEVGNLPTKREILFTLNAPTEESEFMKALRASDCYVFINGKKIIISKGTK